MCGVIGVSGTSEAAKEVFLGLITLQHRGQDAAGILSYDSDAQRIRSIKNKGLVESVFSKEAIEELKGTVALGHTRYSTVGTGDLSEVQPLVLNYPYGVAMVHNGNIVNYLQIKERLQNQMRRRCLTNSDTEAVLNWFAHHVQDQSFESVQVAVQSVFENIQGSFSIVGVLGEGRLFAFRDPNGIRPLVLGKKEIEGKTCYMVASESIPLSFLGYQFERDLKPGELIYVDAKGKLLAKVLRAKEPRPCMFEWVYFSSAESEIEQTPVYSARLALGRSLGQRIRNKLEQGKIQVDLVAPVPDTSRTAAISLAEELKLPYREVLIKNRYITRTFILGSQSKRQKAVDLKLNPVVSELKGKNIILVDDSIVRGTTSKKIVQLVKRAGANKVYFASTCPPIRFPCFYGIDFPDPAELIAAAKSKDIDPLKSLEELENRIAQELGADGVIYQNIEGLVDSLNVASQGKLKKPCMACLDAKYPTDVTESFGAFADLRRAERRGAQ